MTWYSRLRRVDAAGICSATRGDFEEEKSEKI
jgi:hypothetical protein